MTHEPMRSDAPDPLVGRLFDGRYEVLERVARGGMASIYRGRDQRLDRVVAIKVMHPGLGDGGDFAARFVREARAAARLSHPHVVQVHDQGTDGGNVFLVMEFVEGRTLRDVIRAEAPMRPLQALALLRPVLQALTEAHRAGLVHRDVKPENVLISTEGQVKVADFGLARAVSADTQHTATGGMLLGTVSYLAPELVVEGRIDPRVDVYAAGVLLFEMLTGTKPHQGENPVQIAYAHVHKDVPAPSGVVPGLPDYVDALVARATARDRTLRPADASILLHHVNRVGQALAEGVDSDPELAADLRPLVMHPETREMVEPDEAPDPFHDADLSRVVGPGDEPTRMMPPLGAGAPGLTDSARTDAPAHRPGTHEDDGTDGDVTRTIETQPHAEARRPLVPPPTRPAPAPSAPPSGATDPVAGPRRTGHDLRDPAPSTGDEDTDSLDDDVPPRRSRRGMATLVLALVLALAVGGGGWWFGWGRYTSTPGVLDKDQAAATAQLEKAGLEVAVGDPEFSEDYEAGTVIRTSPGPGDRVLSGGTVTLTVSRGKERYQVPPLAGMGQTEAEDALTAVHLTIADVKEKFSEKVPEGKVIASDPVAGTETRRDDTVTLLLSKGRKPRPVTNWIGKDADRAAAALGKKFTVEFGTAEYSDTVPKGAVLSQEPHTGTLYRGDVVRIVTSRGPELVAVPDVVRSGVDAAVAQLEALGFKVDVRKDLPYIGLGYVLRQSPGGGKKVPKGSTIVLHLV